MPKKLIRNWEELSKVPESKTHRIELDETGGVLCSGFIVNKENNDDVYYLSTHTFYGSNYQHCTQVLNECGFNIKLANWDAEVN